MMNANDFLNRVVDCINEMQSDFVAKPVIINNDGKTEYLISTDNATSGGVAFNLTRIFLYEKYWDLDKIKSVSQTIVDDISRNKINTDTFISRKVIEKGVYFFVNGKNTEQNIDNFVKRKYLGLTITYKVEVEINKVKYCYAIQKCLADTLGFTEEELFMLALKNTERIVGVNIGMFNTEKIQSECQMYLITSKDFKNGSAIIMCNNVLENLSDFMNDSLFILPSSVDELIVVQYGVFSDCPEYLLETVKQINSAIDKNIVLSDNIFIYDRELKNVRIWKGKK